MGKRLGICPNGIYGRVSAEFSYKNPVPCYGESKREIAESLRSYICPDRLSGCGPGRLLCLLENQVRHIRVQEPDRDDGQQ
jgi:hypothetical protein